MDPATLGRLGRAWSGGERWVRPFQSRFVTISCLINHIHKDAFPTQVSDNELWRRKFLKEFPLEREEACDLSTIGGGAFLTSWRVRYRKMLMRGP